MRAAPAALGVLVLAVHAAGFVVLAARCRGTPLSVELTAPPASAIPAIEGSVPSALASRVVIEDTGAGPGLHRRRWTVRYRGGVERSVGAAQLTGPFQDPATSPCVARVVVGQALLDDGHAGPGTIAAAMQHQLEAELAGGPVFPVGGLVRIERLQLRWARLAHHPEDRALVGDAPRGYVRAAATLVFDRVAVPVIVALIPTASGRALRFRIAARAALSFDSRIVQWLSDRLGGDKLATRLARHQIDDALITAFAPPPPFELPGGQTLRFTYCNEPPEIEEAAYGALPFAVVIERAPRAPTVLPPRLGPGPRGEPAPGTRLALDLDLDALNALLYELWRGGFLDRQLAHAGLARRFNADPTVTQFLSLRLSDLTLTLPPVVRAAPGGLRLSAEARLGLRDGAHVMTGRVWGGLEFRFAARGVEQASVELGELELSCEATSTTLVPCYGDLVAALRGRAGEFHGVLTTAFTSLLADLFVGRFTARGLPLELVIQDAKTTVASTTTNASLHVELAATLGPPR